MVGAAGHDFATLAGQKTERRSALNAALVAGRPTKPIRRELAEIDKAAAALTDLEVTIAQAKASEADAEAQQAAEVLAAQVAQRIAQAVDPDADGASVVSREAEGLVAETTLAVALAQRDVAAAGAVLKAAEAEASTIRARIGTLDQARATVIARRAGGVIDDADAEQVALLDADREGLAQLLADADAVVASARRAANEVRKLVTAALAEVARTEREIVRASLLREADRLGARLQEVLAGLDGLGGVGGRGGWDPGGPLYGLMRKAAAANRRL